MIEMPVLLAVLVGALGWIASMIAVVRAAKLCARPRRDLWLWIPLTLLLGPLAALVYLTEIRISGGVRTAPRHVPASPPTAVLQTSARQLPPTTRLGSGIFLYVRYGSCAHQAFELPFRGELVVRRGFPGESSLPGVLALDDPAISRRMHCRVIKGEHIELEDASSNGTLVDGHLVQGGRVRLKVGSIVRVGSTTLVVMSRQQVAPTTILTPLTDQHKQ